MRLGVGKFFLGLVTAALLVAPGTGALAQDASPVATPFAAGRPLDLAAMTILPDGVLDEAYGARNVGSVQSPAETGAFMAGVAGVPETDVIAALDDAGMVRRHNTHWVMYIPAGMATPVGVDNAFARDITLSITEFATPDGAAAAMEYIERDLEDLMVSRVVAPRVLQDLPFDASIGDDADLTLQREVLADTGLPAATLNLTFRQGALIGDVAVTSFIAGDDPTPDELAPLAEALSARMDEVMTQGAPGISNQVVRFDGYADEDRYLLLDGHYVPAPGDPAAPIAQLEQRMADRGISDVYTREQFLGETSYLTARVVQFVSPAAADAFMAEPPARVAAVASPEFTNVAELEGVSGADDTRAFTYLFPMVDPPFQGTVVARQVGDRVTLVAVDDRGLVDLSAVLELADAAAACLAHGACATLTPLPIPSAFSPPTAATPDAVTPAAATPIS